MQEKCGNLTCNSAELCSGTPYLPAIRLVETESEVAVMVVVAAGGNLSGFSSALTNLLNWPLSEKY